MTDTVVTDRVDDLVGPLRAAVDELIATDLTMLAGAEVSGLLGAVEVQRRRFETWDQQVILEADQRGTAGQYACTSTRDLLISLLRVAPAEAKARVRRAAQIGARRSLYGEILPPALPTLAAALAEGSVSAAHADVIVRVIDQLPGHLSTSHLTTGTDDAREDGADEGGDATPIVEKFLVDQSLHLTPPQVARAGAQLLARLDPDGAEPRAERAHRRRELSLYTNPDGTGILRGRLTPAAVAVWTAIIDVLSQPIPAGENGEADDRTPSQRRHDALLEAGNRLLRADTLPASGGVPATIIVHTTLDDLHPHTATKSERLADDTGTDESDARNTDAHDTDADDTRADDTRAADLAPALPLRPPRRTGVARTAHGQLLDIAELLRLAGEADIIPVYLSAAGGILSYGRARRLASCAQRLALAARDLGCSFPDQRPRRNTAHHVPEFRFDRKLSGPPARTP